jgi:hypothetical protein
MIHIYDRATMAQALTNAIDPQLRTLLRQRSTTLTEGEYDLTNETELVVIDVGDTEKDIVRLVGFSPLVEPIDGSRFGEGGFTPFWDWLIRHEGWFELTISFGSTFAYVLFIRDGGGVDPELLRLCRYYA